MHYVVRRLGFRISRGTTVLILLLGAVVAMAFWVGPLRPLPPDLRLMALGADGRFREQVEIPSSWADSLPSQRDVPARFPLVLAVYNTGARPARPIRLALSVPNRVRIANTAGNVFRGRASAGNPLTRYVFAIDPGRVPPRQLPRMLSTLDTLWLAPVVPTYNCTSVDSIPEFSPAPAEDPNTFSQVRIFYSFDARVRARQTGLLSLKLDPNLLRRQPAPELPVFPVRMLEPEYPRPAMTALRQSGANVFQCGEPGNSIQILSVLYQTPEGGRFFVLYQGKTPRKYLFDLNRDSIIELEMWDPDRDGRFEAARAARMPIPEFVMPPRSVVIPIDSAALADSLEAVTARLNNAATGTPVPRLDFRFPPPLFGETDAGPFRFWRELQRARGLLPPEAPDTTVTQPERPRTPETTRPPARAEQPARTEPPARQGRPPAVDTSRLLGKPVPTYPTRRDTIPGGA
jgi:hypothetical protein